MQSQPLIVGELGHTTSHRVPSPNSQVTWGQSVQSQPLIARKLSLTTSHGVPSPNSQVTWGRSMQSQPLIACKLGLTTSHGVPSPNSQVWHGCLHDNTFWRWGLRLGACVEAWVEQKARPNSPNKSWAYFCINYNPTLMMTNHILTVSWGSKFGTWPPCWDLGPHVNRPWRNRSIRNVGAFCQALFFIRHLPWVRNSRIIWPWL
jgi:hypothetical protein